MVFGGGDDDRRGKEHNTYLSDGELTEILSVTLFYSFRHPLSLS